MRNLRKLLRVGCVSICGMLAASVGGAEESRPAVFAHYMPWYASKPVSGHWGWHWTMGHFDPEVIRKDGSREAATHDEPLIGLYDSSDPDALACQVLLMKLVGIEGVIIDWYGIREVNDYAEIHRNTLALIPFLKKAGLKFAICYEDQSIGNQVKAGKLSAEEALTQGREVMAWLEANWFGDVAYFKVDERPVMLMFGPQYFERESWDVVQSVLTTKPLVFALPHLSKNIGATGSFAWPPVTGGKTVSSAEWRTELDRLYASDRPVIPVAFPGFHDIYERAELHESYGHIDDREGKTFAETLDLALKSESAFLQIATWNDYGEGTVIEPTRQKGYRNLETLQERVGSKESSVEDLRLPVRWYRLKKGLSNNGEAMEALEKTSDLLFDSQWEAARKELNRWQEEIKEDQ